MDRPKFNTKDAEAVRGYLADIHGDLEKLAENQPEHGQYITFAKNHVRMAYMELGFGTALTKGLDPFANQKVEEKK